MSNFKKAFTVVVSVLTIMWSVGVAFAPQGVSAAAMAGDLVKQAGSSTVYYFDGSKLFIFPNEGTFKSWYADFSGVKTIPSSELVSLLSAGPGGNVTMRPGTKLVKITDDPKTYAVEPGGMLRHVSTEAVALALYGSNWNTRIVDVPIGFWVNYRQGTAITSNVHPTGTLIKYASGSTLYIVENGMKRPFASASAEFLNMINSANAITTTITYPDGSSITGKEAAVSNVAGSAVSGTPTSAAGLTVAGGSMTPSTSLPKGGNAVKVGEWKFTAGPEGAVSVSGVTFKRTGVGTTSDVSALYLYDGANRLTSGRTINSSTNEATFTVSVSVPAGSTKTLSLVLNVSTTANSGDEHIFMVESAAKVSSNATAVNGVFPVSSNLHSIAGATAGTLSIEKSGSLSAARVGDLQAKVSEFKLSASTEDAWVKQITLTQGGSISRSGLTNMTLKQNGVSLATASAIASNDRLDMVFSPSFKIEKGNNRIFELYADVNGKPTTDTYSFYTDDVADVQATGGTYGVGMTSSINANFDSSGDTGLTQTLQGGQFTINWTGPAAANVSNAGSDVMVWKGTLYSANQVEIRNWRFLFEDTDGTDPDLCTDAATCAIQDLKIWNLDNNTVIAGPNEFTPAANLLSSQQTFTDDYTMTAGQTMKIGVSVDVRNQPGNGLIDLRVTMGDGTNVFTANDIKNVSSNTYLTLGTDITPSSTIQGQIQTITAGALTMSTAASPTDAISVKGVQNVMVTSFNFAAGSGSSVKITSLPVTANMTPTDDNEYGAVTLGGADVDGGETSSTVASLVLSAKLMDGLIQVGNAKTFVTGVATFDNLSWVIPASQTKKLDVVVTFSASATLSATSDFIRVSIETEPTAVDAEGNTVSGASLTGEPSNSAEAAGDVVREVKSTGSLTATMSATPTNPSSTIFNGGSLDRVLAAFKYEATDESFYVKKLTLVPLVAGVAGTGSNDRIDTLKVRYPKEAGGTETRTVGLASAANLVDISDMPMYVPQNGSANFEVLANFAAFATLAGTEAENIAFGNDVDNSSTNNQATGVASNTDDNTWGAADITGNRHDVFRTILSSAAGSGTPNNTTRTRAAGQKVLSMNLTASSTSSAFVRGSRKAPDGAVDPAGVPIWTATGGGTAALITSATNFISGTTAITSGAGTANTAGTLSFDFDATPGLAVYGRLSAWVKITLSAGASTATLSFDDTAALGTPQGNSAAITADATWQYVDFATTGITSTTQFVGITFTAAGVGNTVTVTIDDMRFYNDSIELDVAGSLGTTTAIKGLLFSLKDSSGTVRAHGAFNGTGGTAGSGTVRLIAGNGADVTVATTHSDVEVSSSALALDAETNSVTLVADVASVSDNLSVSFDTGTNTSAGDFRWYDNSDSAGSNDMASLTVISPTSTTTSFSNSY